MFRGLIALVGLLVELFVFIGCLALVGLAIMFLFGM